MRRRAELMLDAGCAQIGWSVRFVTRGDTSPEYEVRSVANDGEGDVMATFNSKASAVAFVRGVAGAKFFDALPTIHDTMGEMMEEKECYTAVDSFFGGGKGLPECGTCALSRFCGAYDAPTETPDETDTEERKARLGDKLSAWGES